ncbi:S-layer protein [Candidatus Magnetoovum chiemensis]|nr:S-layer protein [Candidatus Magnetoovum chiemensis]
MIAFNITSGCDTSGNYCPNDYVTRAQMAVFVLKALGQTPTDSDVCTGTMFDDVTEKMLGNYFCKAIEKFARLNITSGCDDGSNFCPDGNVTRAQMAVFMLKGLGQAPTSSDTCNGAIFNDVNATTTGDYFCKAIEKFRNKNVTSGCDDGSTFCPNDNVMRSQMALFLTKGFLQ